MHRTWAPSKLTVSTVDAGQGDQYDFVVLNTVTPGGAAYLLEFITDTKKDERRIVEG